MNYHRCLITGRRWLSVWRMHVGFGPIRPVERIMWGSKLLWWNEKAQNVRRLMVTEQE